MELRSAEDELSELSRLYQSLSQGENNLPPLAAGAEDLPPAAPCSATELLQQVESIQKRLQNLQEKINRFDKRRKEKDPVTEKPRYGEKTMKRVEAILALYNDLQTVMGTIFGEEATTSVVIDDLRTQANQEVETRQRELDEEQARLARAEAERKAEEARKEEERRLAEEAEQAEAQRQRNELARQAEEARLAQVRARQAEEAADRQWVASIQKGSEGVKEQLRILVEATRDDPTAQSVAIGALHTIFSQIVARPEETNFRRIRRDHPRFNEDIGRHAGGKELLIAAGFVLGAVDDVPSYISKEPSIEKDMDGWANWFDLLKDTLAIIEEQLMK